MYASHGSNSKRITFVFSAAVAALAAGCAAARLASVWAPSPVAANGLVGDWSDEGACSVMKDGLQLTVANDAERLHVMAKFRSNDPQWSRAAGRGFGGEGGSGGRGRFGGGRGGPPGGGHPGAKAAASPSVSVAVRLATCPQFPVSNP